MPFIYDSASQESDFSNARTHAYNVLRDSLALPRTEKNTLTTEAKRFERVSKNVARSVALATLKALVAGGEAKGMKRETWTAEVAGKVAKEVLKRGLTALVLSFQNLGYPARVDSVEAASAAHDVRVKDRIAFRVASASVSDGLISDGTMDAMFGKTDA
jgi:hypothetical protein